MPREPEGAVSASVAGVGATEGLPNLIVRCVNAGHPVERAVPVPGIERVYVADPFGNRIELIERS